MTDRRFALAAQQILALETKRRLPICRPSKLHLICAIQRAVCLELPWDIYTTVATADMLTVVHHPHRLVQHRPLPSSFYCQA
jgi:hypothetical protein